MVAVFGLQWTGRGFNAYKEIISWVFQQVKICICLVNSGSVTDNNKQEITHGMLLKSSERCTKMFPFWWAM